MILISLFFFPLPHSPTNPHKHSLLICCARSYLCPCTNWVLVHRTYIVSKPTPSLGSNFSSFSRYLLKKGANVAAVNNDGDLAIDIAEDEEMEKLLQEEMDKKGLLSRSFFLMTWRTSYKICVNYVILFLFFFNADARKRSVNLFFIFVCCIHCFKCFL